MRVNCGPEGARCDAAARAATRARPGFGWGGYDDASAAMIRVHPAAGGGRVVEIDPGRVGGWLTRFADRHGGIATMRPGPEQIVVLGGDGTTAALAVPFPPLSHPGGTGVAGGPPAEQAEAVEPIESLLAHISGIGDVAMILVRERAHSVGICRAGVVQASSTDTRYVQSRTAAGGWSQQRYARRRGNQRRDSFRAAADTAVRVFAAHCAPFAALVVGGDITAIRTVLADPRLAELGAVPRRTFTDIAEPRRAVLDEVARRCLTVEITVRDAAATSET